MPGFTRPLPIPDRIPPEDTPRWIRAAVEYTSQQIEAMRRLIEQDPRMTDERVTKSLRAMENNVSLDRAMAPVAGEVLVALDRYHAAWAPVGGTGATGGTPTLTLPVHDHTFHTDRTREIWMLPESFAVEAGAPALGLGRPGAASPDRVRCWQFNSLGDASISGSVGLPLDWLSGNLTFKIIWAAISGVGVAAGFIVNALGKQLTLGADSTNTANSVIGTLQVLPTTNPINYNVTETTLGTFAASSAKGLIIHLNFQRDITNEIANYGFATAQTLGVFGFKVEYTAEM